MSNNFRYVRGDTKPVFLAPASATVIEIGDLLYLDSGVPKPASALADAGSLAANQEAFHDAFIGVAEQQSRNGDTDEIRIATAGEFEYPCASASFDMGDLIGAVEVSAGNALEDQKVVEVATENLSIGYVSEKATTKTAVRFRLASVKMTGGAQAKA